MQWCCPSYIDQSLSQPGRPRPLLSMHVCKVREIHSPPISRCLCWWSYLIQVRNRLAENWVSSSGLPVDSKPEENDGLIFTASILLLFTNGMQGPSLLCNKACLLCWITIRCFTLTCFVFHGRNYMKNRFCYQWSWHHLFTASHTIFSML